MGEDFLIGFFLEPLPLLLLFSWRTLKIIREAKLGEEIFVEKFEGRCPAGPAKNGIGGNSLSTLQPDNALVKLENLVFVDLSVLRNGIPEIWSVE